MANWLSRSKGEEQNEQVEERRQERSAEAEAEVAARRLVGDERYQQLMARLAAERAAYREQAEQRRQVAIVEAEALLKIQARLAYSGTTVSFEQDWPAMYGRLVADAESRQHAIDRACGPYFLSERGLVPHRHQPPR